MTELIVTSSNPDQRGLCLSVTPSSAGWKYVGFEYYRLKAGQSTDFHTGKNECCVVAITGTFTLESDNFPQRIIGKRQSVFEGIPPEAVYLPNESRVNIDAESDTEIGVCLAPGQGKTEAKYIPSSSLKYVNRGKGSNTRYICDIMMGNESADSLLVVEVRTPSAHWSSYPPHKHDQDNLPHESLLEETYFHKISPEQGFITQRVYNDDLTLNETMTVLNNQVVLVPEGYHPVGVPYGYESYYLNVMAGPKREWVFHNDPKHEWLFEKD